MFDVDQKTTIVKTRCLNGGEAGHTLAVGSRVLVKWGSQILSAKVICMSGKQK